MQDFFFDKDNIMQRIKDGGGEQAKRRNDERRRRAEPCRWVMKEE
jgi:hypothetical protein